MNPRSRRCLVTRFLAVAVLLSGLFCARAVIAQDSQRGGLIQLTDRAWAWVAVDDRSSNGALFVGDDAALVVDPGLTPGIAREFLAAARNVTDRPIRWAVLTHWHPDHALGVVCTKDRGFELVAHAKTRRALAERGAVVRRYVVEGSRDAAEGSELRASRLNLPEHMIEDRETFDLGGHDVEVFHVDPAHTTGDLVVWSPQEGVLVTGDLFMNGSCPSMGEGSVASWIETLAELESLRPRHVVPGHFAVGTTVELARFRGYLEAQWRHADRAFEQGWSVETAVARASFAKYGDYLEYPQYGATFADNARVVYNEWVTQPAAATETHGFSILAVLDVGEAPHQITFSPAGDRVFIAAAGSDRVTIVDTETREITGTLDAPGVPLGIAVLPGGDALAVSAFRSDHILEIRLDGTTGRRLVTGEGSSLFLGPLPGVSTGTLPGSVPSDLYLLPTETADKLWVFDAAKFKMVADYPTGGRPFPPAATSDGRKAFVPNYDDGTLTVIDLWNEHVVDTVEVGAKPSGAAALPGDVEVAVAVRGENKIVFVNTASHRVTGGVSAGIGEGPFSVVVSGDGRFAYVNNTSSHDISVIALDSRRVIARVPVGEIPIVMAAHPKSGQLWIGCEGSHELYIVAPPAPDAIDRAGDSAGDPARAPTQVAVMGMIHSGHRTSDRWGLAQVEAAIRAYAPDVIFTEIPPDRWDRAWSDWAERGVIEEPRVKRFPEYTDVLLELKVELGFDIEPCAAWTKEMSDLRQERIRQFREESRFADKFSKYEKQNAAIEARHQANPIDEDDPFVIHSDRYDARVKEELGPYDTFLNDWIGPGGWTNINAAHYVLIEEALKRHAGRRVLITFGAGHKYWFLEKLRERDDIELMDLAPYLGREE